MSESDARPDMGACSGIPDIGAWQFVIPDGLKAGTFRSRPAVTGAIKSEIALTGKMKSQVVTTGEMRSQIVAEGKMKSQTIITGKLGANQE